MLKIIKVTKHWYNSQCTYCYRHEWLHTAWWRIQKFEVSRNVYMNWVLLLTRLSIALQNHVLPRNISINLSPKFCFHSVNIM
jgi:hypothetical protein